MNIFNNKTFDLIIGIGEDCACSSYIRKFNLQFASYPFDWLTKSNFDTRIKLILNNFKDFFNKEDFNKLEKPKNAIVDLKCDYYENKKTDFYFYHDFESNLDFDNAFDIVKNRYDRRIKRLYRHIKNSKNILFIFWARGDFIDNDKLKKYQQKLKNKFKQKNIYLLFLENTPKQNEFIQENISDFVLKIKYDMTSYDTSKPENECIGNTRLNDEIFKLLKIKKPVSLYLKNICFYLFVKLPSMFIPIKQTRRNFREKMKLLIFKES